MGVEGDRRDIPKEEDADDCSHRHHDEIEQPRHQGAEHQRRPIAGSLQSQCHAHQIATDERRQEDVAEQAKQIASADETPRKRAAGGAQHEPPLDDAKDVGKQEADHAKAEQRW
jgi:hypothetical protein